MCLGQQKMNVVNCCKGKKNYKLYQSGLLLSNEFSPKGKICGL